MAFTERTGVDNVIRILTAIGFAAITLCVNSSTYASLMVADPDLIWEGATTALPVNTAFSGVTFSTNANNGNVLALGGGVTEVPGWAPAVFGHYATNFPGGACSGCWSFGFAELRADFDRSAKFVSFDFIDRYAGAAMLEAYNDMGDLLGTSSSKLIGHSAIEATRVTVDFFDANGSIAYVLVGANNGVYGVVDRMTWIPASVPEPATLALLGLGLLGFGSARKKTLKSNSML